MEDILVVINSVHNEYDRFLSKEVDLNVAIRTNAVEQNLAQLGAVVGIANELNQKILSTEDICNRVRAMTCSADGISIREDIAKLQDYMADFIKEFPTAEFPAAEDGYETAEEDYESAEEDYESAKDGHESAVMNINIHHTTSVNNWDERYSAYDWESDEDDDQESDL